MKEPETVFGFEKLGVWQRAIDFAQAIYKITRAFPREELFGLTAQLRRAGVSIAANIAEGASRSSAKDRVRFLEIAYGSLNEVATLLHIAHGEGLMASDRFAYARSEISEIGRMLSGLRKSALSQQE